MPPEAGFAGREAHKPLRRRAAKKGVHGGNMVSPVPKKKTAEVLSTFGGRYMPVYEGGAGFLILSPPCLAGAPRKGDLAWGCATIRWPGEVAEWLKAAPC
jgi:hypothetical protein